MNVSLPHPAEGTDRPAPVRRSLRAALGALLARLFVDTHTPAPSVQAGEAMPSEDDAIFERRCPYMYGLPPMY